MNTTVHVRYGIGMLSNLSSVLCKCHKTILTSQPSSENRESSNIQHTRFLHIYYTKEQCYVICILILDFVVQGIRYQGIRCQGIRYQGIRHQVSGNLI